jgi:hypothetical protein
MKPRSDVPLDEFRSFIASETFDRFLAELAVETSAVRWSKTVRLAIEANVDLMAERGSGEPVDAVLELPPRCRWQVIALRSTACDPAAQPDRRKRPAGEAKHLYSRCSAANSSLVTASRKEASAQCRHSSSMRASLTTNESLDSSPGCMVARRPRIS